MTEKNGNSYTTGTTTNSVEITTTSQVFLITVSSSKVPPSDCDNVRQPEMTTWARACNFWQSFDVEIIRLHFYRARHHQKSRICRWNFDDICHIVTEILVISTSGNLAAILDFWYTSMSYDIGNITTKQRDPKMQGSRWSRFSLCALELEICLGVFLPPPPFPLPANVAKKPLTGEGLANYVELWQYVICE